MKNRRATPLLRAVALGALLTGPACGSPPTDVSQVQDSRLILQGEAEKPWPGHEAWIEVKTGGGTKRIVLPQEGAWPRPFLLSDADLGGLEVDERVTLTLFYAKDGKPRVTSPDFVIPARSTGMRLKASTAYTGPQAPQPIRNLTSRALDLEGTIEQPAMVGKVKQVRITVMHGYGVGPTQVLAPGPFPLAFHLQGGAYAHVPLNGPKVTVRVEVETEIGPVLQAFQTVDPKSAGVVFKPTVPSSAPTRKRPVYGNTKGVRYPDSTPPVRERAPAPTEDG